MKIAIFIDPQRFVPVSDEQIGVTWAINGLGQFPESVWDEEGNCWKMVFRFPLAGLVSMVQVTEGTVRKLRSIFLERNSPVKIFCRFFQEDEKEASLCSMLNVFLEREDNLRERISAAVVKLRKTRALPGLGRKEIGEVRRNLEDALL